MNWQVFNTIFSMVGPQVLGGVEGIVAALSLWARPALIAGMALYVFGKLIFRSLDPKGDALGEMALTLIIGSLVIEVATSQGFFGPQLRAMVMTGAPGELMRAVSGRTGAPGLSPAAFDDAWGRAFASGLAIWNNLPGWSAKGAVLGFVVILYWITAAICIGASFIVWAYAFVMTVVMVEFWPLGVGAFAFPWTRFLAWGWVRQVVSNVLLQVMITAVLALLLTTVARIISEISTTSRNELVQIGTLFLLGFVYGLLFWAARQLPGMAAAWAHGFTGFGQTWAAQVPNPFVGGGSGSGGQSTQTTTTNGAGTAGAPGANPAASPSPIPTGLPPGRAVA